MVTKSIPSDDDSNEHLSEMTIYVPYKGATIVARIFIGDGAKQAIQDRGMLRAILTGVCTEAVNQCLQVAGHIDEGRIQNYHG
jgi:hypothetical protein